VYSFLSYTVKRLNLDYYFPVVRAASMTEEVGRMRPPRCVPPDNVIQPYVKHEAEGVNLLKVDNSERRKQFLQENM